MVLQVKDGTWKQVKKLFVRQTGVWLPVRKAFVKDAGVWKQYFQDELVITLTNNANVVLRNLFTQAEWDNAQLRKRVIVPAGITIGADQGTYALATTLSAGGQSGSFSGELILEIYGTVQGIGGLANSGVGGNAIWGNFKGKTGQNLIVNLYTGGLIRAGGGGGGKGGQGGPGFYNYYAPSGVLYAQHTYHWEFWASKGSGTKVWWAGTLIYEWTHGFAYGPLDIGGWRYTRGAYVTTLSGGYDAYQISRQLITPTIVPTAGGLGGNGGRGQGHDGANAAAMLGSAGGTNAGVGGTGGTGATWGNTGNTGGTGASGNNGAGSAGVVGGLAGGYLFENANITFNNLGGTVLGRLL